MRSTEGLRSSWWLAVTREKTQMPTPVGISARSCCWARGGPARVRWAQSASRSSRAALDVIGLCRLRQRECLATKAIPERDRHNPKVGIIAVPGALLGVAVGGFDGVIDVDVDALVGAGQDLGILGQVHQDPGGHGVYLADVAKGERPQERAQRGGG